MVFVPDDRIGSLGAAELERFLAERDDLDRMAEVRDLHGHEGPLDRDAAARALTAIDGATVQGVFFGFSRRS